MSISSFIRNIRESVGFLQLIIVVILAVVQRLILLSLRINNATDFRLCLMCIPCAHKISHLNCVTFKKSQKKSRVSDIRSGGHNNEMRQTPPTTTMGRSCKRDGDGNSRTHTHISRINKILYHNFIHKCYWLYSKRSVSVEFNLLPVFHILILIIIIASCFSFRFCLLFVLPTLFRSDHSRIRIIFVLLRGSVIWLACVCGKAVVATMNFDKNVSAG